VCRRLYSLSNDDVLWKAMHAKVSCGRAPAFKHHVDYGKSWKWVFFAECMPTTKPCYWRDSGVFTSRFTATLYTINSAGDYADDESALYFHGYARSTNLYHPELKFSGEGLWWRGLLREPYEDMPEDERGRTDINRPFNFETTTEGTGYAVIDRTFYKGEWKDHKPHGRGRAVYPDGSVYCGDFAGGKAIAINNIQ
jgi:hypothetical protein